MDPITRQEAKDQGLLQYFTGKPCRRGHVSARQTSNATCLVCANEKGKRQYRESPEKFKERAKANRAARPDDYRAAARARYQANRDTILDRIERYRARPEFKIEDAERQRRWRERNAEKKAAAAANYKARMKAAPGRITAKLIEQRKCDQKGLCFYCDREFGDDYEVDHIIPLARRGTNLPDNIAIACRDCNQSKKAKWPWDFFAKLARSRITKRL